MPGFACARAGQRERTVPRTRRAAHLASAGGPAVRVHHGEVDVAASNLDSLLRKSRRDGVNL